MANSKCLLVTLLLLISISVAQANPLLSARSNIIATSNRIIHRVLLILQRIPQFFRRWPCEWIEPSFEPSDERSQPTPNAVDEQILALYRVMEVGLEGGQPSKSRYDSAMYAFTSHIPYIRRTAKSTSAIIDDLFTRLAARLHFSQTAIHRPYGEQNVNNKIQTDVDQAVHQDTQRGQTIFNGDTAKITREVLGGIASAAHNAKNELVEAGSSAQKQIERIFGKVAVPGTSVSQETKRYKLAVSQWASDRGQDLGAKEIREYVKALWEDVKESGYEGLGLKRKADEQYSDIQFRKTLTQAGKQVRRKLETISNLARETVWDSWDEDTRKVVKEAMQAITKMDRELMEQRDEIVKQIKAVSRPYTNEFQRSTVMKELRSNQAPLVHQWANEVLRAVPSSLSPELKQMISKHFEGTRSALKTETDGIQAFLGTVINSDLFQSFTGTRTAASTCGMEIFLEWREQMFKGRLVIGLLICVALYLIDSFFDVSSPLSLMMEIKINEYRESRLLRTGRIVNFRERVSIQEEGPARGPSQENQNQLVRELGRGKENPRSTGLPGAVPNDKTSLGIGRSRQIRRPLAAAKDVEKRSASNKLVRKVRLGGKKTHADLGSASDFTRAATFEEASPLSRDHSTQEALEPTYKPSERHSPMTVSSANHGSLSKQRPNSAVAETSQQQRELRNPAFTPSRKSRRLPENQD